MKETTKAYKRRRDDPFWKQVFKGDGIDIGSGDDPFRKSWFRGVKSVQPFDMEHGDAEHITRCMELGEFDFVHSSNCLEHMRDPVASLREWFALLRPGGHLVFTVPDEDLYEQGVFPSRWNADHKWTFTMWKDKSWSEQSINVLELVGGIEGCQVRRIHLADTNYDYSKRNCDQTFVMEDGVEAFIEVVLRKTERNKPEREGRASFKHSGARGDIVYSLPAIKALGGGTLYINLSNEHYAGKPMRMEDLEMFRDLLGPLEFIDGVEPWEGESVDYDLDLFRELDVDANLLTKCHLTRFDVVADLSEAWIPKVRPLHLADIVVGRSQRYHGPFEWHLLKPYQDRCAFVGFKEEHEDFQRQTGLEMPMYTPKSLVQLAAGICGSKLFVGNQSFPYALAEAMKHPRVLEVCPYCPNCNPQSGNGHIALSDEIIRAALNDEVPESVETRTHSPWRIVRSGITVSASHVNRRPLEWRPMVSCVIPTAGDFLDDLRACCEAVLAADEVGEVVVACVDRHNEVRKAVDGLNVEFVPFVGQDEALACNMVADRLKGEYLCVVREDVGLEEGWCFETLACFVDETVGMVGPSMKLDPYPHVCGPFLMLSRRAYEDCGLFAFKMPASCLSELELCLRLKEKRYSARQVDDRRFHLPHDSMFDIADSSAKAYLSNVHGVGT